MKWTSVAHPIIGLAPLDGITDASYREIVDTYGHPDVMFTEFVPAEAVARKVPRIMRGLLKHKTKTPIIAQLFGITPQAFYESARIIAPMGFDGIDINMGCPDRNINKKGGGAALIRLPQLAKRLIAEVKRGIKDSGLAIPVSVKTRIGLEKPITKDWISMLLEASPDAISIHGRTLIQMYHGLADWEEIAKAAKLARGTKTIILGNGDISSVAQAKEYSKTYSVSGVLIGRAALGNPWIFADTVPEPDERFSVMLHHCRLFMNYRTDLKLFPMRKHLAWYAQGFDGASQMRNELMHINTYEDVVSVIQKYTGFH